MPKPADPCNGPAEETLKEYQKERNEFGTAPK